MNKCIVCDKDSGKGKCCSATCRSRLARSVAKGVAISDDATLSVSTVASVSKIRGILNFGQPGCECMHCQDRRINHSKNIINHGPYKPANQLGPKELNRVSLPGDPDYTGIVIGKSKWRRWPEHPSDAPACLEPALT